MRQQCIDCKSIHTVPRYRCPVCGSRAFAQADLPTHGRVDSWTEMAADGGVNTFVLVVFPDGTRSFGDLLLDGNEPSFGAEVQLAGQVRLPHGTRRLFRLV